MCRETRLAFEAGARMLSFGLVYIPGAFADTEELVAVARVAAEFGVPLVPHVRNEGAGVLDAVREMIEVSERSGAPLHVSHLKSLAGEELLGPLLDLVDGAGATFDQYPYGAGATLLASLLPPWAQRGAPRRRSTRARDPEPRRRIAGDVAAGLPGWENQLGTLGPANVVVAGRTIAERGGDPVETVLDLLLESELAAPMIIHYAGEDAVRKVAAHRRQLVGSDGIFGAHPHPRLYGTAPRFLGRFALREGLVPWRRPSPGSRPAPPTCSGSRPRPDRGRQAGRPRAARPGGYVDTATYDEPMRSPDGVVGVWVAGEAVVRDGAVTGCGRPA